MGSKHSKRAARRRLLRSGERSATDASRRCRPSGRSARSTSAEIWPGWVGTRARRALGRGLPSRTTRRAEGATPLSASPMSQRIRFGGGVPAACRQSATGVVGRSSSRSASSRGGSRSSRSTSSGGSRRSMARPPVWAGTRRNRSAPSSCRNSSGLQTRSSPRMTSRPDRRARLREGELGRHVRRDLQASFRPKKEAGEQAEQEQCVALHGILAPDDCMAGRTAPPPPRPTADRRANPPRRPPLRRPGGTSDGCRRRRRRPRP